MQLYIYERPLGVNNSKSTTPDEIPIVNSVVYHPFDHIVAFSGIGKHPLNGMPLPVCCYKFDKISKVNEESAPNTNIPSTYDATLGIKPPTFLDTKNNHKDKLSPMKSIPLHSTENDLGNSNELKNDDQLESKSTAKSPEKIKSILHQLDQFLLERGHQ